MIASRTETWAVVDAALQESGSRIDQQVDQARADLPDQSRVLDEFERTIDDIEDVQVQSRLRRILIQLDEDRLQTEGVVEMIANSRHWTLEPLKAVTTDLLHGFL